MRTFTPEQWQVINAIHKDAEQTFCHLSTSSIVARANQVLDGKPPRDRLGMMVADAFKKAGFIKEIPKHG